MKKVKKIIVSFLLMCMLCVGMTCVASATAAEFRFSDPQTSVGAEVDVTAKVSSAKALNTIQATLSYDKTKLRFISGYIDDFRKIHECHMVFFHFQLPQLSLF